MLCCLLHQTSQLLCDSPYLAFSGLITVGAFVAYYRTVVIGPVLLRCKNHSRFGSFLRQNLAVVHEHYRPTFWCFEARLQTIFASLFRHMIPDITYRREVIQLADGGEVCLDWRDDPGSLAQLATSGPGSDPSYSGPIILFLPGLTGHSQSEYIKSFINVAHADGIRCAVFNYRGRGGLPLATPRTYCASNSDDLDEVVGHVRRRHPKSPLVAVGVSLGGIILGNYLKQQGDRAKGKLLAAMLISTCWDVFKGSENLEKDWINNMVLNRHLAGCLVDTIKEASHHFDKSGLFDLQRVFSSKTIREFDASFTSPQFGYSDVSAYYSDVMLAGSLSTIRVPVLALNALDDPMQPGDSLPVDEICATDSVALLTTRYGGHIGFMEGILPTRYHFSDRVFSQFIKAVFKDVRAVEAI